MSSGSEKISQGLANKFPQMVIRMLSPTINYLLQCSEQKPRINIVHWAEQKSVTNAIAVILSSTCFSLRVTEIIGSKAEVIAKVITAIKKADTQFFYLHSRPRNETSVSFLFYAD